MAGEQEQAKEPGGKPDGVTLGVLIAMRAQMVAQMQLLDSLIGAHTPPQAAEQAGQGGRRPPATFGGHRRTSNGG